MIRQLKQSHPGFVIDFVVAMGSKVAGISSAFLLLTVSARMLPPSELGKLVLAFATGAYLAVIADFGLNKTVLRALAERNASPDREQVDGLLFKLLTIASVVLVLICMGYLLLSYQLPHGFKQTGLFVTCWGFIHAAQLIVSQAFRGLHDILNASIFSPSLTLSVSLICILVAWGTFGPQSLGATLTILVASGVAVLLISTIKLLHGRKPCLFKVDYTVGQILHNSFPIWLGQAVMSLLVVADLWIVGIYFSDAEAGVYGLMSRLVAIGGTLLVVVNSVLAPRIASLYVGGQIKQLQKLLRKTTAVASVPAVGLLLLMILSGNPLLELLFGDFFRSGGVIFSVLCVGQIANVITGPCGLTLLMTGNNYPVLTSAVASLLFAVSLSLLLRPHFGMIGIAVAFSLGLSIQQGMLLLVTRQRCRVWTHASYLFPFSNS